MISSRNRRASSLDRVCSGRSIRRFVHNPHTVNFIHQVPSRLIQMWWSGFSVLTTKLSRYRSAINVFNFLIVLGQS
jgi:hypothetical protein